MTHPSSTDYRKYPRGPNFGLIVFLAGVALILILLASYFVLSAKGKRLLPNWHNPHPTSYVMPSGSGTIAA